ncbi:cobalamin-binding protein [Algiphilus sp.]|uniref:cobalamin-binding protein n=1 Tax=Algiphilus sp. TaxID=1872431 RepID=UPI0032EB648B
MPPAFAMRPSPMFRCHAPCQALRHTLCALLLAWASVPAGAASEIRLLDDADHTVQLAEPAERIVSLAPHLTENLFAIGAGAQVVGAVSFSDYPQAAQKVPRVGGYSRIDLERVLALAPDLVVAWRSGNDAEQLARLRQLGIPVYTSESRSFEAIAETLLHLGALSGQDQHAATVVAELREGVAELRRRYRDATPVRVFYQVWEEPLMTVSDAHLIAQAIALCGGQNIFAHLDTLIPRIDRESVLAADPEVIVAGGMGEDRRDWLEAWKQWPELRAVREGQLVFIPPSLIQRHTPRVLEGTRMLCDALATTRAKQSASALDAAQRP